MIRRNPLPLLAALIVMALPACDNVDFGRLDVQIVPPAPAPGMVSAEDHERTFAELGMPTGTVLFHVMRDDDGTNRLAVIGEVVEGRPRELQRPEDVSPEDFESRFRDAVLERGGQFALFRRGARVGTFQVTGTGPSDRCGVPTATGTVNTVAAAADVREMLAFREGLAPQVRGEFTPPQITGSIRTYASIVAERLILQAGLPRPRSWAGSQRDLQAIEVMPGGHPEMAATYLVGDNLGIGPGDERGYSVFYIADYESRRGYVPVYSDVRNYMNTGKQAPRIIDYMDWNENGEQDIVLRVYGPDRAWYETVQRNQRGDWVKTWEGGRCD
jgi:hypothetical protein